MHLEALLWLFLPMFVAGGSALLSYYVMQARMEVALAKERETLAEARATIVSHKITLEERVKATEESSKRKALDDFMQDIRIEERSYVREAKSLGGSRKTMVMQERLFFRNIPLSNWIEHEMLVEDGRDLHQLSQESVFASAALPPTGAAPSPVSLTAGAPVPEKRVAITRLLNEVGTPRTPANEFATQLSALSNSLDNRGQDALQNDAGPQRTDLGPQRNGPLGPTVLTPHAAAFGAQ